jgi:Zn-finger nucleic acid-binding protein
MEEETVKKLGPDVVVDVCRKCGGTWYDRGELARTATDRSIAERLTEEPIKGTMSPMACPRCGGRMRVRHEWGVEVDVCILCEGVWLDLGEREELEAEAKAKAEKGGEERARKKELAFYRAINEMGKQ